MPIEDYKDKLLRFYEDHKRMPGYREMMDLFGFKSKNSVYKLVNRLVEEGVIEKDSQGRISPANLGREFKLLGSVQAGFPTAAEQDFSRTVNLNDYFAPKDKSDYYILTVSGDSMIEASIEENDMVIVEKTEKAKEGDIVVACVDGDWTLKYLRRDRANRIYLEPANSKYKNIYPEFLMKIAGVVRGVMRKY